MATACTSESTAAADSVCESETSRLGGIEALRLKRGSVRRNLFGPVDHQQLQQDFQRLLCLSIEVANKRWNFDFQSDMPGKDSDIEWEELRCQDVPAFYRSAMVQRRKAGAERSKRRMSVSSSGEGSCASSSSSGSGDEFLEVTTKRCYRIQRPWKRRQSSITDFFKVKKRKMLHYKMSSRQ
ncbi:cyclin-dependent kinase inhibitor 1D [Gouania willdenowi]|uniref:Cyclin-dependent kinase inhibitor 1-like n=1 Tax=Gouania willdenowi TaxID=441366 RepID=A0A8C5NF46_GOUWI|nr:cyclin-dependent kinase inhibitor 1-like [Gouania willdenowi]XP_028307324.1 cyclin-dependent kinase inhibitor 1-like [Gouania willdenowi]